MEYQYCQREHFCIIGKEGSTRDGADVVRKLWEQANGNFDQIAHLASCTDDGTPAVWGAMTDFSRTLGKRIYRRPVFSWGRSLR